MNKKGQALVEFLLILPVLILIIFVMVDFGRIYYTKISLSAKLNDIDKLYKENKNVEETIKTITKDDQKIKIKITNTDTSYIKYEISKEIDIITPGLSYITGNPYKVIETRTSYYE